MLSFSRILEVGWSYLGVSVRSGLNGLAVGTLIGAFISASIEGSSNGESQFGWWALVLWGAVLIAIALGWRSHARTLRGEEGLFPRAQHIPGYLRAVPTYFGAFVLLLLVLEPPHRPRANARRSSCQSNLKQVMLGIKEYLQDNDDKYPLLDAGHLQTSVPPSSGWICSLQPYLKSLQIFQCPSESNTHVGFTDYA